MRSDAVPCPSSRKTEKLCDVRHNTLSWFPCSESPYSNFPNWSDWFHVNLAVSQWVQNLKISHSISPLAPNV